MEFRKIISFGKTSFVMSIPKTWILKNKLKKGDLIGLEEMEGNLILTAKKERPKKNEQKEIVIAIDDKDMRDVQREINSAYIHNYNTMILNGKAVTEKTEEIRSALKSLIALEVVEQTATKIIAKDFLNMEKISIPDSIKKMDMITRSMMLDLKSILNEDNYDSIHHRDNDVNRLSFLLYRAIKYALDNPSIYKMYGLTTHELIQYWYLVTSIERIADNAKRIVRGLRDMKDDPKLIKECLAVYGIAENRYLKTINAFYNKDTKTAYAIARSKQDAMTRCDVFIKKNDRNLGVIEVTDKIKQMIADTHDITRAIYLFLL